MILIFTRDSAEDQNGLTVPYTCLGQVDYVQHAGERPIVDHLEAASADAGRRLCVGGRGGAIAGIGT